LNGIGSGVEGLSEEGEVGASVEGAERTAVAAMVTELDVPDHD